MSDDVFRAAKQPDSPIKFIGQAPPQMKQALNKVRKEKMQSAQETEQMKQEPQQPQSEQPQAPKERIQAPSQARATGSPQLEELIDLARGRSMVYDEIRLPSLGRFYNGTDGPQDGILHIRPMTGQEEQILATPRFVRKGAAINMIFQRCIKENFNPDNFLSQDRTYLLIFLRGISYGHEYEVEIKCLECDRRFNHSINLNSFLVNYSPDTLHPPLMDVLPKSQFKFNYKLARGKDETMVQDYRDRNLRMFGESAADESLLYRLAILIDDIEGLKDKQELMMLLKQLPIQDVSYIRNLTSEPPFGVDTRTEIICPSCTRDFEIDLPLEANFFFPKAKRQKEEAPPA